MSKNKQLLIFLYTGYTPRATALRNRIEKACGSQTTVTLIDSEASILEKRKGDSNSVVILDLPNIKQPALQTVKLVKKKVTRSKLIAIHIYTTKLLIDPLFEAGIDGYLPYEPEPTQLKTAIDTIMAGDKFLPVEFYG
ncbi:hypothetical protein BH23BAC3_BH23BAC3_04440 [soil metagenome]